LPIPFIEDNDQTRRGTGISALRALVGTLSQQVERSQVVVEAAKIQSADR
jgi:hypothetical protein